MYSSGEAYAVLRKRLYLHWLRPERALFGAYAEVHAPFKPYGRSVELGCGDGLNTFLRLGGLLDPDFDYAWELQTQDGQADYSNGLDIYNAPIRNPPKIIQKPSVRFSEGIDRKPLLLERARSLETYEDVRQHDLTLNLPYESGTVDFAYSNVLYWLNNPRQLLDETSRVLKSGGTAVFEVFTTAIEVDDFYGRFAAWGQKWCNLMDRGRTSSYPGLCSRLGWEEKFHNSDFRIKSSVDILPRGLFLVWNVGLRPIYPILKHLIDSIPPSERQKIRKQWVDTFLDLLSPVFMAPQILAQDQKEPIRLQYVLEKI